jgi:hypothetical protein
LFILASDFLHVLKSDDLGPVVLLPPQKEDALLIFITHKNPIMSGGFEPAKLGSDGRHANHYTTETNKWIP